MGGPLQSYASLDSQISHSTSIDLSLKHCRHRTSYLNLLLAFKVSWIIVLIVPLTIKYRSSAISPHFGLLLSQEHRFLKVLVLS